MSYASIIDIAANIKAVNQRIALACERAKRLPSEVTLIAITKSVPVSAIREAYELGIRHFGENRVQEAELKVAQLAGLEPKPTWHMTGHLQTNKAKKAVEMFDLVHTIDSFKVADMLNRFTNRPLPVLLQVNVSGESSKSGFPPAEVEQALHMISSLPNLKVKGLMTIAPLVDNAEDVRPLFRQLRRLRDSLSLEHLSMGMSNDFEVAIEEGATMVRIGRAIFGERQEL